MAGSGEGENAKQCLEVDQSTSSISTCTHTHTLPTVNKQMNKTDKVSNITVSLTLPAQNYIATGTVPTGQIGHVLMIEMM